jgi:hypothetical protein
MPGHPSGTQGNKGLTAGCISEFQMMFAELAVADGKFENVGLAISEMEMRQAQNKLDMEELLKELDIDRGLAWPGGLDYSVHYRCSSSSCFEMTIK